MKKPIIKIHDLEFSKITEREMTNEEFAHYEKVILEAEQQSEKLEQTYKNRLSALAKLAALGLTEDEIAAL